MEEAVVRKIVDNVGKGLEMLEKLAGNILWKMSGNFFGFPQGKWKGKISTGRVEKKRVILWKTLGKMWKADGKFPRYLVAFMLVMMAFTVSA